MAFPSSTSELVPAGCLASERILPQAPILFNDTAKSLVAETKRLVKDFQTTVDSIVSEVDKEHATFENVIKPFAVMENEYISQSRRIKFYSSTHQDKEVRDASLAASKQLASNQTDFYMRHDFYQLADQISKTNLDALEPQGHYYLQKLLQEFERKGVALPPGPKREELMDTLKRIDDLTADGRKNFNANTTGLWLRRDELKGLPQSFLN